MWNGSCAYCNKKYGNIVKAPNAAFWKSKLAFGGEGFTFSKLDSTAHSEKVHSTKELQQQKRRKTERKPPIAVFGNRSESLVVEASPFQGYDLILSIKNPSL